MFYVTHFLEPLLESDPTRMCALLVGLPTVEVLGVGDRHGMLEIMVASEGVRPECECAGAVHRHGVRVVRLADLPVFGRPTRLAWRKQRWRCTACGRCWTDQDPKIGSPRSAMTARAGRWVTIQVGRHGRSVSGVATDLGCEWHTVMDAVMLYGTQLIDHPDRIGIVTALGLDETLFARLGRFRTQSWSTQIVDVRGGQLLDIVEGRDTTSCCDWLAARPSGWLGAIRWATLDLSAIYRKVFDTMVPDAIQVADPFHVW